MQPSVRLRVRFIFGITLLLWVDYSILVRLRALDMVDNRIHVVDLRRENVSLLLNTSKESLSIVKRTFFA